MPAIPSIRPVPETDANESRDAILLLKTRGDKWRRKKHREHSRKETEDKPGAKIKELVREDVYLMENKHRRFHVNLLANSLTARLRKNLPEDANIKQTTMKKLRRESLKDFLQLDNLNKQWNGEMTWQSNRLDKETFQMMKRQNHLKKQTDSQRRTQDKLELGMLTNRSALSSASLLPRLVDSVQTTREPTKEEFPEFAAVDKDDTTHVKVFKLHGVFQPTNKYSSSIEPLYIPPKVKRTTKENDLQDSLRLTDSDSPVDLPSRSRISKKGMNVTWSRQSRYYDNGDALSDTDSLKDTSRAEMVPDSVPQSPTREDNMKTPLSVRSFKSVRSDTFLIKKQPPYTGRSNVQKIGLNWKLPAGSKARQEPTMHKKPVKTAFTDVSHNLSPVSRAMDKDGSSTNKTRWHVQKIQSPTTVEMYRSWLDKLESLKGNEAAIRSRLEKIPDRAHLSVMTQPARC